MTSPGSTPALVAVGGWIATGKSTLARGVAERLGAQLLVADQTRSEFVDRWDERVGPEAAALRNLSPYVPDRVYEEMIHRAKPLLQGGRDVVLDGCFATRRQRMWAKGVAQHCGAAFHLLLCRAAPELIAARLDERTHSAGLPPQTWNELLDALKARWEDPTELREQEVSWIRTDVPPAHSLARAIDLLPGSATSNGRSALGRAAS